MPARGVAEPTAVRHLAVEASRLLQEQRGIGRYVRNLLREFCEQRPGLHFTVFVERAGDTEAMRTLLQSLHPALNARTWVETVDRLPHTTADVVWYPWNFVTAPAHEATMVVTVHDISPMLQLDHRWWKVLKRAKYKRRYVRTARQSHAIVTDSTFSRDELVSKVGADASRISITLLAADDLPLHLADDSTPLDTAQLTGRFFSRWVDRTRAKTCRRCTKRWTRCGPVACAYHSCNVARHRRGKRERSWGGRPG